MFSAAKLHVMYRVSNTPVRLYPFPHLYVEDVFPASFYAEIRKHMVGDEGYSRLVDTGRVGKGYSGARYSLFPYDLENCAASDENKQFWKSLFATFSDIEFTKIWLKIFGPTIADKMANLPPEVSGGRSPGEIGFGNEIFLMRDRTTYSLGPHTDTPRKVVSVLFYLPPDESGADMGTSVYLPKDRSFTCKGGPHHDFSLFEHVATAPYKPNCMMAFPQTPRSFHGVEPVTREGAQRDLLLFDIKVAKPKAPRAEA